MRSERKDDLSSCPVCKREPDHQFRGESLCPAHRSALENIRRQYKEWIHAYGSLSRVEYLKLLMKNPNSGEWTIEVASFLLEFDEAENL